MVTGQPSATSCACRTRIAPPVRSAACATAAGHASLRCGVRHPPAFHLLGRSSPGHHTAAGPDWRGPREAGGHQGGGASGVPSPSGRDHSSYADRLVHLFQAQTSPGWGGLRWELPFRECSPPCCHCTPASEQDTCTRPSTTPSAPPARGHQHRSDGSWPGSPAPPAPSSHAIKGCALPALPHARPRLPAAWEWRQTPASLSAPAA